MSLFLRTRAKTGKSVLKHRLLETVTRLHFASHRYEQPPPAFNHSPLALFRCTVQAFRFGSSTFLLIKLLASKLARIPRLRDFARLALFSLLANIVDQVQKVLGKYFFSTVFVVLPRFDLKYPVVSQPLTQFLRIIITMAVLGFARGNILEFY